LEQQAKFRKAIQFVTKLSSLFKITYRNYEQQMTARNNAVSQVIRDAITELYPDYSLEYSKVKISKGRLLSALSASATAEANSFVRFNWTSMSQIVGANPLDRILHVTYCPLLDVSVYDIVGTRSANEIRVNMNYFAGETVETWIAFISPDLRELSDSIYTGSVTVS
jgi:hypothetical protein